MIEDDDSEAEVKRQNELYQLEKKLEFIRSPWRYGYTDQESTHDALNAIADVLEILINKTNTTK